MNISTRRKIYTIVGTVLTALLFGCGGGGGGPTGSGAGTGSGSPNAVPLQFTTKNQGQAAVAGVAFGVLPLGMAQMAADWTSAVEQSGNSLQLACNGGGSATLTLTQGAAANPTAAGSQLTATLNACYIKSLGDAYTGTAVLKYQTPASGYQQSVVLTLQPGFTDVSSTGLSISGEFAFDISADTTDKVLHVYSGSNPLTLNTVISGKSSTEVLTAINSMRRISLQTARTTTSINFSDQSGILQGSFNVATQTPLSSWFDAYPDAGSLTISGAPYNTVTASTVNGENGFINVYSGNVELGTITYAGLCDYLFSGTGWLAQDGDGQTYQLVAASTQSLTIYQAPSLNSISPITGPFTWYFSRTLAGMTNASTYFYLTSGNQNMPWVTSQVNGTITIQDATLTITPTTQFNPGSTYQLFTSYSGFGTFNAQGGGQYIFQPLNVTVANTVSANLVVNGTALLLGPTSTLDLDSSGSSASGAPVSSTQWSQISGPPVNFSSTSTAITTISPASAAIGNALIQVAVTDQSGEVAYQQVTISVIGDTSTSIVAGYSHASTGTYTVLADYMGGGTSYARSSNAGNIIDVLVNGGTARILAQVDTGNAFTSNTTLSYPDGAGSNLVWIPSDGSGCSSATTGQMNVLNTSYASDGSLKSLAMDFTVNCNGAMTYGVVRFNSAIPFSQ